MPKTMEDLMARAESAIARDEDVTDDVATHLGQIRDNVRHMQWFKLAVARRIAARTGCYRHLVAAIGELPD